VEWQVTATTLYCDIVNNWVTVLTYKDGTTKCGYAVKHGQIERKVGKNDWRRCPGPSACALCIAYKEKIFREEAKTSEL